MIILIVFSLLLIVGIALAIGFIAAKVFIAVVEHEAQKTSEIIQYVDEGDAPPRLYQESKNWIMNGEDDGIDNGRE